MDVAPRRILDIGKAVLAHNQGLADALRSEFAERGLVALNIVSSPGAGKTALLERTLSAIAPEIPTGVIVGDLATDNDARRLEGKGARVLQVTTDGYCHLEANMVREACRRLGIDDLHLLIIENVGNLVCPSSHDLGEDVRVALHVATEGEDKPLKYPVLFKSSHAVVVSKIDLAAACEFDLAAARANIAAVAPQARVFVTSAKTGAGLDEWLDAIRGWVAQKRRSA
ncbi:MAG: hydrogenase nickel incorporation protein HypB [Fimbriimonadaceae bacterium]